MEQVVRTMERAVAILPADDLSVAKAFYVDVLGFRVQWEATADGKNGLIGVERGSMVITIDAPMSGHGREACVSLHVDDADAYYREWRDKADTITTPRDEEWGARTFGVTDPSGNTIFIIGPPAEQVSARTSKPASLVPLAHVQDVPRSMAFYQRLGFDVANTHVPEGAAEPVWAWLRSAGAHVMLARASDPVTAKQQGVLFYLYVPDVSALRQRLLDAGVDAGPITHPFYCPRGEFRITDPDGYVVMVAHT
jgi:predicted enzyme related to lactoylglutathione lyase